MNNEKKIYEMEESDINEFIKYHIPIKIFEKNKYGAVFTNPVLINKILDLFPTNIWSKHNLKWLDPSVGTGFFMIFVYLRLMNGLKKWESNDKKRSDHIIKNMLFMVEINKKNCDVCKSIFGSNVRLICGDFLSDLKFPGCDDNTFNCIVGNPPFQDDYGLSEQGKRINGGKNKLYERIFLKSYNMLKNGGYISFVVPDNLFSGNGSLSYQTILRNYIPFVSFNPNNQTYFHNIQQPVCYFILNKINKNKKTLIEHDDKLKFHIQIQDRPVNPIRNWTPFTENLINKYVSKDRNNVSYNRGKSLKSYRGNKYSVIFTPSKMLHTNNNKLAPGIGLKKAIIFSISPDLAFKMDYSGKFGVGPNTFFIPFNTNSEGKKLEKFLNSDDYKTLAQATKTSRQYIKIAFLEHLKLTKILNNKPTKKHIKYSNNKTRKRKI